MEFPPRGKIVFTCTPEGYNQLCLMNADGSNQTSVSPGTGYVWSPDSKKLSFSDQELNLWYVDLSQKDPKPIKVDTDNYSEVHLFAQSWSPDSRWLAFSLSHATGYRSIYVWRVGEPAPRRVTGALSDAYEPVFDVEGKYLFFLSDREYAPQISTLEWDFATTRTTGIFALALRKDVPPPPPVSFVGRKAANAIRRELLTTLKVPNFYSLDRLDLTVGTTIDTEVQKNVSAVLSRLGKRDEVQALGLVGHRLLGAADPAQVNYSVLLYERGANRNYLRVHSDNLDEPFDINSGAKLILGSTAQLRTMITYLDIMADLHRRYAGRSPETLRAASAKAGVLAMTRSLAVEWARYRIRLNAIAPGPFPTEGAWSRLVPSAEAEQDWLAQHPMRRFGRQEELAALAAFLLSDHAEYINGECVTIDGGLSACGSGGFSHLLGAPAEFWDALERERRRS